MLQKARILTIFVIIISIMACAFPAMAAATKAVVSDAYLNVYRDPALQKFWGTVSVGTTVTIKATVGNVSKISLKGKVGYCEAAALTNVSDDTETILISTETIKKARVYRSASVRSAYKTVPAGTQVDVIGISGSCAKIKKGKYIGYVYVGHLKAYADTTDPSDDEAYDQSEQEADTSGITSLSSMIASGKFSNEQIIFAYAVKAMGYNAAAAAGLLANISAESGFKTGSIGDSGTSYGLCQWHASRKTRLINYCTDKGLDASSLEGQLEYLKYELEKYYPSVHKYMLGVDDSADGAYDAGYYFCYNFEAPANRVSKSKKRATTAQTKYFPKYADYKL